jgi:hypothetical protein
MKKSAQFAIGLLFFTHEAAAQASWSAIGFAAPPQNTPALVAAADKMLASPVGKEFPGQLYLQTSVADGNNPATHAWVPIYESAGQREAWVAKLQASPAWSEFLWTIQQLSEPAGTTLYRTVASWGDINDTDTVWAAHAFRVDDPAAFVAAVEKFLASPTGKKSPGQVHLSAVVAGGITPVTTVISVGYASEAEMEAWIPVRNASTDWTAYVEASDKVAEYLGTSLARTVKRWGTATLRELTD